MWAAPQGMTTYDFDTVSSDYLLLPGMPKKQLAAPGTRDTRLMLILWMFVLWLVFTSRLSSQITWLTVKPIVNPVNLVGPCSISFNFKDLGVLWMRNVPPIPFAGIKPLNFG